MEAQQKAAGDNREGGPLRFSTRYFGTVEVVTNLYHTGGRLAVELEDEHGELVAVLSVNLPDRAHLHCPGEFFAKTWTENEELAAEALESGIFRDTGRTSGDDLNAPIWAFR